MSHKKTIVIIDDEIDFTKMASMMLEQKGGFKVGICNQGTRAVETIREWQPDLILLDIMMPDKDGSDIAAELRKDPELCIIPIIFFTSLMTPSEAAGHPVFSNYGFIPKPIETEDLLRRVQEFFKLEG